MRLRSRDWQGPYRLTTDEGKDQVDRLSGAPDRKNARDIENREDVFVIAYHRCPGGERLYAECDMEK